MIRRIVVGAAGLLLAGALAACGLVTSTNRSVFVIFDVSGTYAKAVPTAAKFANMLVAEMQPGDWIGASQISACSFSEKEIILQRQLPQTPSLASEAKRELFTQFSNYSQQVKPAKFTDIRGAIAQAAFELRQRPEQARYIVLFTDMIEDFSKSCNTEGIKLDLAGIHVIAANVIKSNPADPEAYFANLTKWEETVKAAGGTWSLASAPDQLPKLVTEGR